MYDIHCHLLPGIDDGPDTMQSALDLARQAVGNGVTHAVITPHIHVGRWPNNKHIIQSALNRFRQALATHQIPLQVAAGAEVRIGPEIPSLVRDGAIPYLGFWHDRPVILIENHHGHIFPGTERLVDWLLDANLQPMIAHPERNKDVMRKPSKLTPFLERGCLLQLTAGSLIGRFGDKAMDCAKHLLLEGHAAILASDAHHTQRRPVEMREGFDQAAAWLGQEAARALVFDNPKTIAATQFPAARFNHPSMP